MEVDRSGNLVIIELKRGRLPRESLAQAIDYAACVSSWSIDKISKQCSRFLGRSLDDAMNERFSDIDLESISINGTQRLILVGCSIDDSLSRMIEWLSDSSRINVNAVILATSEPNPVTNCGPEPR